jgi:hypothetical protein
VCGGSGANVTRDRDGALRDVAMADNGRWSLYGAPWLQPVASGRKSGSARKPQTQAKTVAMGCDQLPRAAHGKEGVDGSSPSEGSAKAPQNGGFCVDRTCTRREVPIEVPLCTLAKYASFLGEADRTGDYRRTLEERPWRSCTYGICRQVGIQAVIFRGTEATSGGASTTSHVFNQRLHAEFAAAS